MQKNNLLVEILTEELPPLSQKSLAEVFSQNIADSIHTLGLSKNINYQVFDVTLDRSAWDIMVDISNQNLAPVIDVDGEVLADFGVTELSKFWEKLG